MAVSTVFSLFLMVMLDLDRAYDGVIEVPPVDITRVAGDLLQPGVTSGPEG